MTRAILKSMLSQEEYPEVVSDQNRSYHQKQIYEHLRALFDLSKMNNHDRTILRCATLLPDDGMDAPLFRSCFQSEEQKALSTLVKRGWLTRSKRNKLTIHPVIREVCREELRDCINSCSDFLASLWRNYDRNKFHLEKYKEMVHVFSCACESNEIFIPPYAHCAWALHLELGDGLSALKYAHAELSHVENTCPLSLQTLATCLHRVGMAYGRSGNPRKSLEYHKRALSIRETTGSSDTHLLSSSYIDVSVASSKMGSYAEALAYAIKALELRKKGETSDDLELAHAYNVVGCCYGYLKDNENSYLYLKKALSIREKSLPDDHPELAEAYGNLAATCADVNESISYDQKAIAIRQNILGPHHPELALSYSNIASNYARLGDFKTAIQYCLQAIEIQESALPPLHPDLAHSFSNIAKIYRAQGDYHKGQLYNEKALSIRTKTLPHNHPDRLASVHDSVWYATKLGNFIKIDEPRWITPDVPSTEALKIAEEASSCISNARARELKENYDAQLKHLHKAEKLLLQILPADNARIIQLLTQIERCYEKKKEYTLACEYCQRLATLGDSFFIMKLGIWKMDGIGCEQNYDESFQLLKRAYELGHARAALDLGWLYLWGYGCKCDVLRAKELFEVQAHAPYNNKTACKYLGNLQKNIQFHKEIQTF